MTLIVSVTALGEGLGVGSRAWLSASYRVTLANGQVQTRPETGGFGDWSADQRAACLEVHEFLEAGGAWDREALEPEPDYRAARRVAFARDMPVGDQLDLMTKALAGDTVAKAELIARNVVIKTAHPKPEGEA